MHFPNLKCYHPSLIFFLIMKMVNLLKATKIMSGMGLFHVKLFFSDTLNICSGLVTDHREAIKNVSFA